VVDVAPDDFSNPLRLLAQRIEFDDPISGLHRCFTSGLAVSCLHNSSQ
jgi:tRNA pseudouridine32 synthase/23S rRNA pseudouridine746 synthase